MNLRTFFNSFQQTLAVTLSTSLLFSNCEVARGAQPNSNVTTRRLAVELSVLGEQAVVSPIAFERLPKLPDVSRLKHRLVTLLEKMSDALGKPASPHAGRDISERRLVSQRGSLMLNAQLRSTDRKADSKPRGIPSLEGRTAVPPGKVPNGVISTDDKRREAAAAAITARTNQSPVIRLGLQRVANAAEWPAIRDEMSAALLCPDFWTSDKRSAVWQAGKISTAQERLSAFAGTPANAYAIEREFYVAALLEIMELLLRHGYGYRRGSFAVNAGMDNGEAEYLLRSAKWLQGQLKALPTTEVSEKRREELYNDLAKETVKAMKSLIYIPEGQASPEPFSTQSTYKVAAYLLTDVPELKADVQKELLEEFIATVEDDHLARSMTSPLRQLPAVDSALRARGQIEFLADAYLAVLPEIYHNIGTVDSGDSRERRITLAEAAIRDAYPGKESEALLAKVHGDILPVLVEQHKKNQAALGDHWYAIHKNRSLRMIKNVVKHLHESSIETLQKVHADLVEELANHDWMRTPVEQILSTIEQLLGGSQGAHREWIVNSYLQLLNKLVADAYNADARKTSEDLSRARAAAEGISAVRSKWGELFGAEAEARWADVLLRSLPSLIRTVKPDEQGGAWFTRFDAELAAASTFAGLGPIIRANAKPIATALFYRSSFSDEIFENYEPILMPLLFPTASEKLKPILDSLTQREIFQTFDILLALEDAPEGSTGR